jgi:hypothetical protein
MRKAGVFRVVAAIALLASGILGATAYLSLRRALEEKIDRAAQIERDALRPAAAARLAAALLERRLASVSEPQSRAVAAAFQHSDASQALADYRASGGDAAIAAEAQRALGSEKPREADAEIALMRAVRGLRLEASRLPRASRPHAPPSAAQAAGRLGWAGAAATAALILAYVSGRLEARP